MTNKRVESYWVPCLDASSTLATSTKHYESGILPLFVFVTVGESRSACGASGDLSASCCECAELLRNNDNRLNISISNKFACRYSIYHLNLRFSAHSFTSWSPLGFCRRSNPVVGKVSGGGEIKTTFYKSSFFCAR